MSAVRLFLCLSVAVLAATAQESYLPISVDAGKAQGRIRFHTEAVLQPQPELGNNYTAYAEAFGERTPDRVVIPVWLTGDTTTSSRKLDWVVFPDRGADPEDPASYDFAPVDAIIAEAAAQGLVAVRLDVPASATANANRADEAARRVAMHFNQGWAEGHNLGIREWRVCDVNPSQGPANDTLSSRLVSPAAAAAVDGLRRLDPGLSVGSCLVRTSETSAADMATPKAPMGRSPHFYSWVFPESVNDPYGPARMAQQIRKQLDNSGLATAELSVLSPAAGAGSLREDGDPAEQAGRLAAALIHLQDAPVASVALDPWGPRTSGPETKRQAVLRAAAQLGETPLRLATSGDGAETYAVLAGRADDRTAVQILVVNHQPGKPAGTSQPPDRAASSSQNPKDQASSEGYQFEVADLPWGVADFGVYAYRIDDQNDLALVWEGGGRGGSFQVRRKLPPQAIELLVLQREDRPVYDRLPRRRSRR